MIQVCLFLVILLFFTVISIGYGFLIPKRSFNPWTCEILEALHIQTDSSQENAMVRFKSKLDEELVKRFGEDYLIFFANRCFKDHAETVRDFQCVSMSKRNTREEPIFTDLSTNFYYTGSDIPRVKIPMRTRIHARLTVFNSLQNWQAIPLDEPCFTYRQRLRKLLKDYCTNPDLNIPSNFKPKKNQLCLVCVPSWSMIDKYMERDKGLRWDPKLHRRTNWEEEDLWQANNWFRGIMLGPCRDAPEPSHCFEFWLPDVCRFVPVPRGKIVPAVFRFTMIPALGIYGCFLPYNDMNLTAEELNQKWYSVFHKGTVFPCTVVGHIHNGGQATTVVRMPPDIEEKLSKTTSVDPSVSQHPPKTEYRQPKKNEVISAAFD